MKILFIDTAAASFPSRVKNAPHWEPHLLRLAAIREDDGIVTRRLTGLVCPPASWNIDPATFPYHRATQADMVRDGTTIRTLMHSFEPMLEGINTLVAHHLSFHEKVIVGGFADAGIVPGNGNLSWWMTYDTMTETANIVQVKLMSQGRWKPPTLVEAWTHFTGKPAEQHVLWRSHADHQVAMVRDVYHASVPLQQIGPDLSQVERG